jgi:hypothetical protein
MGRLFLSNRALKGVLKRDEHPSADNEMPLNELVAASGQDSRSTGENRVRFAFLQRANGHFHGAQQLHMRGTATALHQV